jgi:hypothetical protein
VKLEPKPVLWVPDNTYDKLHLAICPSNVPAA